MALEDKEKRAKNEADGDGRIRFPTPTLPGKPVVSNPTQQNHDRFDDDPVGAFDFEVAFGNTNDDDNNGGFGFGFPTTQNDNNEIDGDNADRNLPLPSDDDYAGNISDRPAQNNPGSTITNNPSGTGRLRRPTMNLLGTVGEDSSLEQSQADQQNVEHRAGPGGFGLRRPTMDHSGGNAVLRRPTMDMGAGGNPEGNMNSGGALRRPTMDHGNNNGNSNPPPRPSLLQGSSFYGSTFTTSLRRITMELGVTGGAEEVAHAYQSFSDYRLWSPFSVLWFR